MAIWLHISENDAPGWTFCGFGGGREAHRRFRRKHLLERPAGRASEIQTTVRTCRMRKKQ